MAGKTIKGITVEIGGDATKLGNALEDVNKKSRDLSSELGSINKLLKLDPGNTELLAQKQQVLADAISNTEEKLGTLREAEKQVQAQFERGEVSEAQYRELQREIIATEGKLDSYKKALQETVDASKGLADGTSGAAEELDKVADEAHEANTEIQRLDQSSDGAAKKGVTALATAAAAAVTALAAAVEASREYRTALGKLDVAFTDSGYNAQSAYKTYSELQGILGETDQAVEAANHLAKLCDTEEDLATWTDIATGVYATFGDSLPIENLTEAANETAKTGQITGGLADALNWAGESEDSFQASLDKCTDEQERQKLITNTLNSLYKTAAVRYRDTNEEVIRANKATEKWNRSTSKIGGYMEPVITDIKEMGAALLEEAEEPMKDVADFVRSKLLPAIKAIGDWVKKNIPVIKAGVAGITATLVLYKVATLASEAATKGVTVATIAQTVAQKALNVAMAATPWGLLATLVGGFVATMLAYNAATEESAERVDALTEEEREFMAAADEAAQSFRDQQAAIEANQQGITNQMGYIQDLAAELQGLADANGEVAEADQARAQFILNELNNALGTEYQMVGNTISQYDELKNSINEVIATKTANALLEAENEAYIQAIQQEGEAYENVMLKQKDRDAQLEITKQAEADYVAANEEWRKKIESGYYEYNQELMLYDQQRVEELENRWQEEQNLANEKDIAYEQSLYNYENYKNTINDYEAAQQAVLEGNTQAAIDLLVEKGEAYGEYSDKVDQETADVLDTLKKQAIDAGIEARNTRRNFEAGVSGYTKEMVEQAEQSYADTLDAFANAYADAEGVGEDLGEGLGVGMESKRSSLMSKARSMVTSIMYAFRSEAESNSPSKKTIAFGEDVGAGAEIGIENKTKDVARAGQRQAAALLDAYSSQEVAGQNALRNIANNQAIRQAAGYAAVADMQSGKLDSILAAIRAGQVLVLDSGALVGGTAGEMDSVLGMRRVLASRGAR